MEGYKERTVKTLITELKSLTLHWKVKDELAVLHQRDWRYYDGLTEINQLCLRIQEAEEYNRKSVISKRLKLRPKSNYKIRTGKDIGTIKVYININEMIDFS